MMDFKCWLVAIVAVALHLSKFEAATTGLIPEGAWCACAGDKLIYNCSVVGAGSTVWSGTVLDCPQARSEITLRHSQFTSNQAFGTCNNGDVVGRGLGVINNCYTSQLNVTVREKFNNKTVQCVQNSNQGTRQVGQSLLSVISATNLYPPPNDVILADVHPGILVFNWTSTISSCSTLHYTITSTADCGTCRAIANITATTITAACSDLPLTTNAFTCLFRVSSDACGLVGNPSLPIAVTLKVPNVPLVEIVPSYSNSQALHKLIIVTTMNQIEDIFNISGDISGSPISYSINASNLLGDIDYNSTVNLLPCKENINGCEIQLPSHYCHQSTTINVIISAANKLGEGPPSNPFMIECTNNFVRVEYIEAASESAISCRFLNPLDTSEKTCCITHGRCDEMGAESVLKCRKDPPYSIPLEISDHSSQRFCYTVTATSDTHTVKVEGAFTFGDSNGRSGSTNTAVATGVVVSLLTILLLVGIGIIIVGLVVRARRNLWKLRHVESIVIITGVPSLKQYLIPYQLPPTMKLHTVLGNCQIQEWISNTLGHIKHGYRRGYAYYEFTNDIENIIEGKEVLLQDKKTKKWFQLAPPEQVTAGRLKLYGKGIARSSFGDQYRVFIQSFGSGARHLPRGSSFLYNHGEDQVEPDVLPLVPICTEYFSHKVIDSEKGLCAHEFCTQNRLNSTSFNIFLTVDHLPVVMRDQSPRDVILMDRVSRQLFTGPYARQMLNSRSVGESQYENDKWKVFVLLEKNKQGLVLNKGSEVLYQDSNYQTGKYTVLDVDVDCVRLSKFIEMKLDCQYEDGKAFYEVIENEAATKEEDAIKIEENFLYCKKILHLKKNELSCEELKLESLIEYFYAIPGVPSVAVKPEQLKLDHHKVFIQSTSQGSRCLKKGEKILYLKERRLREMGRKN